MHEYADKSRLVAKIVRSVLATESFDSLADLTDAVKFRCANLRIGWTPDDINAAFRLVASNAPLTVNTRRGRPARQRVIDARLDDAHRAITREDAAAILQRLGIAL